MGSVSAAWPDGGTRVLLAGSSRVCGPVGPGRPCPALETTARSPRGPDLGSWGCSVGGVPGFSRPLRPQTARAWSQALLRKALRVRRERNPEWNPEAGVRGQIPTSASLSAPWRGAYPCGRPGARLFTPGQASSSSGNVYAVRFATAPSAFPAARKSWSASAMGRLDVMAIGEPPKTANLLRRSASRR